MLTTITATPLCVFSMSTMEGVRSVLYFDFAGHFIFTDLRLVF